MKQITTLLQSFLVGNRYALSFNGTTQYANLAQPAILNFGNGPFSIECWVNIDANQIGGNFPAVIDKGTGDWTSGNAQAGWHIGEVVGSDSWQIRINDGLGSPPNSCAIGALKDIGNVHIAATVDAAYASSPKIKTYLNGILANTANRTCGSTDTAVDCNIGRWREYARYLKGSIDELRIYNKALSTTEIANHFSGFFADNDGRVGYWGFDEGSGSSCADLSGYNSPASLANSPSFLASTPYPSKVGGYQLCDLLTLTLNDGTVIHATNADIDITFNSVSYSSNTIRFGRSKSSSATGGKVAELELDIYADSSSTINGVPLLQAVRAQAFDGAQIRIDTLFLSDWNTPVGIVNNFLGLCSNIEAGRTSAHINAKSYLHLLNVQMPRNLYQPGCMHQLYDAGCTANITAFTSNGTIEAGSANLTINCAALSQAAGYFTRGFVTFSNGNNTDLRYSVSASVPGTLTLTRPLRYPVSVGDAFTVCAGCDHQQSTCNTKFSNLVNFRGFPYVPIPETAV